MDLNTAKDIATIAAPFSGAIVTAFLKPALEDFSETLKKGKKNLLNLIIDKFDDYLIRSYKKQIYVKTLVFQNKKILLSNLYIPLTVSNSDSGEGIKIDSFPSKLFPIHSKVLLVDTAGMGKSTLSRYLFLKAIEEGHGIPVFFRVKATEIW